MTDALPAWTGDTAALRAVQDELARKVVIRDDFPKPLRTVAGFDVGFEDDGATTRAAAASSPPASSTSSTAACRSPR